MQPGKRFESNFEESVPEDLCCIRLYDPGHGYSGITNICDYIVFDEPNLILLELKSRKGTRVNVTGMITDNQYSDLKKHSKYPGVVSGVLLHYSELDETWFIDIKYIERYAREVTRGVNKGKKVNGYMIQNEKGLDIEHARKIGIKLPGKKLRVNWEYEVREFIDKLKK